MAAMMRQGAALRYLGNRSGLRSHNPRTLWAVRMYSALALPSDIHQRIRDRPLEASYDPVAVEAGWQAYWSHAIAEKRRLEKMEEPSAAKQFSMLLPPPNVTGALHIGHALTITIQDTLARWHYMRGFSVRWIPGLDHAGIATQSVVERKLAKDEGVSKHDLGREAFLDRVWAWNDQYGGRIMHQIDQLGAVINKDESFFTLDDSRSNAVIEAFVRLHERGLVFRKRRMVNWCPTLRTAISDIEVDSESLPGRTLRSLPGRPKPVEFGVMHRIRYKVVDSDNYLQVDTTRPETIFGDVAVAVHSKDPRYLSFHGKHVLHPFDGRHLPVIVDDELVNMELGTGVVKVTPAHDPRDYECGIRHQLPEPVVIDEQGKLCGEIDSQFLGLDRFEARERVVASLEEKGLYVEKLDHPTTLSICSRSGDVIEPLLKPQWFVDCRAMAERAAGRVRNRQLTIEPSSHEHTWFFFLDAIQDWCVSRQLWWGHRIPAYRVGLPGIQDQWIVARSIKEAREKAIEVFGADGRHATLDQDEDVLDTWFSSGLLPLSVSGWPLEDPNEHPIYPLSVMETGSDILFFWVARMAMLCEEFTGEPPFKRVLLHPMVRDKAGRKMSKSLGNVIDPLHVIAGISLEDLLDGLYTGNTSKTESAKAEKELRREFPKGIPACGTDALRSALASYLQQGRQINMDLQRVVSHRQFCNKLWNAVRYALPLLERKSSPTAPTMLNLIHDKHKMSVADRWILSRLAETVVAVNSNMHTNQLASSVAAFQRFFVQDLCDVYIEFSKRVLYGNRVNLEEFDSTEVFLERQHAARLTLFTCLDFSMRLLHPFAPFVTEELWQRIRTYDPAVEATACPDATLLFAPYPQHEDVDSWVDPSAEQAMTLIINVLHAIRSLRHTVKTVAPSSGSPTAEVRVRVLSTNADEVAVLGAVLPDLESQARLTITVDLQHHSTSMGAVLRHSVSPACTVEFPVPDDPDAPQRVRSEIRRLRNRAEKMAATLKVLEQRQESDAYRDKVPEVVQQQESARFTQLSIEIQATQSSIDALMQLEQHY